MYSKQPLTNVWIILNLDLSLKKGSIETFDCLSLYTTIPYVKFQNRLQELIYNAFQYQNGSIRINI